MDDRFRHLRRTHRFLIRHALYPLILASGLGLVLVAARVYRSQQITHSGLVWNLILAWVPYLASLWAWHLHQRYPRRWWLLLPPAGLWLAFFPNAPYIVTDFWHLHDAPAVPLWYDVGLLALFSLAGLFLGLLSLQVMHRLVRDYVGGLLAWLFALTVLGLGALGVYLGRFLRWNSWDLLLNPRGVLADVAHRLANPGDNLQIYGFVLLFGAILLVSYLTLASRERA
ncbi:MAG: DUF1361 domain-containing protein [Anaerolineae bacterium]|jgi:uncharacterized membrane protein